MTTTSYNKNIIPLRLHCNLLASFDLKLKRACPNKQSSFEFPKIKFLERQIPTALKVFTVSALTFGSLAICSTLARRFQKMENAPESTSTSIENSYSHSPNSYSYYSPLSLLILGGMGTGGIAVKIIYDLWKRSHGKSQQSLHSRPEPTPGPLVNVHAANTSSEANSDSDSPQPPKSQETDDIPKSPSDYNIPEEKPEPEESALPSPPNATLETKSEEPTPQLVEAHAANTSSEANSDSDSPQPPKSQETDDIPKSPSDHNIPEEKPEPEESPPLSSPNTTPERETEEPTPELGPPAPKPSLKTLEPHPFDKSRSAHSKILVNILGDRFADGTAFKGDVLNSVGINIVTYLNGFLQELSREQSRNIFSTQESFELIKNMIHSLNDSLSIMEQPSGKYKEKIKELQLFIKKRLESKLPCVLLGGWRGAGIRGHTVYYEIILQDNRKYTLRVYNRGAGVDYHSLTSPSEVKLLRLAFYERVDIEEDALYNPLFLKSLLEIRNENFIPGTKELTKFSKKDIYRSLFESLGGKEGRNPLEKEKLLSTQKGGTCPWKSLTALFATHLTPEEYRRLVACIKMQVFWDYVHHRFLEGELNQHESSAFEKTLAAFIHHLKKSLDSRELKRDEFDTSMNSLMILKEDFDNRRDARLKQKADRSHQALINRESLPLWESSIISPLPTILGPDESYTKVMKEQKQQLLLNIANLSKNPSEVPGVITQVLTEMKVAEEQKSYTYIIETIHHLLENLPLPRICNENTEENIWEKLAKQDPKKALQAIFDLGELHLLYTSFLSRSSEAIHGYIDPEAIHGYIDPEVVLDTFTFISILDSLILHTDPELSGTFGIDFLPDYKYLSLFLNKPIQSTQLSKEELEALQKRGFSFQLQDPTKEKKLQLIHEYFESRKNHSKTGTNRPFAFETIPLITPKDSESSFSVLRPKETDLINPSEVCPEAAFYWSIIMDDNKLNEFLKILKEDEEYTTFPWARGFPDKSQYHKLLMMPAFDRAFRKLYPVFQLWLDANAMARDLLHLGYLCPPPFDQWKCGPRFIYCSITYLNFSVNHWYKHVLHGLGGIQTLLRWSEKEGITLQVPYTDRFDCNFEVKDRNLKSVISILKANPKLSENEVMISKAQEHGLEISDQEFRRLLLLATNKPLQIDRLLAYYSENGGCLLEEDHRTFFNLLFMENGILSDALKRRPELYKDVITYLNNQYGNSKAIGDLKLMLFYLNLFSFVEVQFSFLKGQEEASWVTRAEKIEKKTKKIDIFAEMQHLIKREERTPQEKSLLFLHCLSLLSDCHAIKPLDRDQFHFIFKAIRHLHLTPPALDKHQFKSHLKSSRFLTRIESEMIEFIKKDPVSALVSLANDDTSLIDIIKQKNGWTFENIPWIFSDDETLQINVKTGLILENFKTRTTLPKTVEASLPPGMYLPGSPVLLSLLKKHNPPLEEYSFVDPWNNRIRVITSSDSESLLIEKTPPDGPTLRLIPAPEEFPSTLKKFSCWIDEQTGNCLITKGPKDNYQILFRSIKNSQTEKMHLERLPEKINKCSNLENSVSLIEDEKPYVLLQTFPGPFSWLTNFTKEENILLWGDEKGKLMLIELPALGLTFNLHIGEDHQEVFACREHPGFFLSPDQHCEILEKIDINSYIILENKEGAKRVLLSEMQEERYVQLDYKKDSSTYKQYLFGGVDANLCLAQMALSSKYLAGYDMARTLLRPIYATNALPSSTYLFYLKNILSDSQEDNHPHAVACRLQAAYLYQLAIETLGEEQASPESPWIKISNDFDCYVREFQKIGSFRLETSVEKKLLDTIKKKNLLLSNARLFFENTYSTSPFIGKDEDPEELRHSLEAIRLDTSTLQRVITKALLEMNGGGILNLEDYLLTRPGEKMASLFVHHFRSAFENETSPRKRELRMLLSLSKFDDHHLCKILRIILEEICDDPKKFEKYKNLYENVIDSKYPSNNSEMLSSALKSRIARLKGKPKPNAENAHQKGITGTQKKEGNSTFSTPYVTRFSSELSESTPIPKNIPPETTFDLEAYLENGKKKQDFGFKEHIQKKLEKYFPKPDNISCLEENELNQMHEDIEAFCNQQSVVSIEQTQIKENKIPEMIEKLEGNVSLRRQKQMSLQNILLDKVNKGGFTKDSGWLHSILNLSRKQDPLSMPDLLILHARKEHKRVAGEHADRLFQEIKEYLDFANETQKHARALKLLKDSKNEKEEKIKDELRKQALDALQATLAYNPMEYPERHVIEHLLDITIRPEQIKVFEELEGSDSGLVLQAIPGFGKTSLIMPLYCLLCADGKNLSVCLVPDQMLNWISEELRERLGSSFDIWLRIFKLEGNNTLTADEISRTKAFLDETRKEKRTIIMGDKSAHCLNIQLTRSLVDCCSDPKNTERRKNLEDLLNIIKVFQKKSRPFGDEAHIWLDTQREVNTPTGKPCNLPLEEQETLIFLYTVLLDHPTLKSLARYSFASNKDPEAAVFTEQLYHEQIKPKLIEVLIEKLKSQPISDSQEALKLFRNLQELNERSWDQIRRFIQGDKSQDAIQFVEAIKDHALANVIYLLRQEIQELLPMTLHKKCDERYTLSNDLAIPARNGVALTGSEFGNPHEIANYTIQAIVKHGISKEIVKQAIQKIQQEALDDLKSSNEQGYSESIQKFLSLSPKNKNRDLFRISDSEIVELSQEVNQLPSKQMEFILQYILPKIRFYAGKLNSNFCHLARLMPKMRAVTGTLAPNYVYPTRYKVLPSKGTDGKTLFTLGSHSVVFDAEKNEFGTISTITISENESPEALFEACRTKMQSGEKVRLITDAAGYLNGANIEKTSRQWTHELQKIEPTLKTACYHQDGKLVAYDLKSKESLSMQAINSRPEERLTILSQPYVTGTDTKQGADIISVVTVGANTSLSLLSQASWRARGIDKQQKVHFILSKDVEKVIRDTLKLNFKDPIQREHILYFTFLNELRSHERENVLGTKLQLREYIQSIIIKIIQKCLSEKSPYDSLLIPEVARLFESTTSNESRDLYSGTPHVKDSTLALKEDLQILLSQFRTVHEKSQILQQKVDVKKLEAKLRKFIQPTKLPKKIEHRATTSNLETTQETLTTTEVSKEQQQENQVERNVISDTLLVKNPHWERFSWKSVNSQATDTPPAISEKISFFMSVKNFLLSSDEDQIKQCANAWDPRLNISFNIATIRATKKEYRVAKPFDSMQKAAPYALIRQDESKNFQVFLLDQTDAEFFQNELKSICSSGQHTILGLYDLTLGAIQKGSGNLKNKTIADNQEVALLLAQAKFFNGYTKYTPLEKTMLKSWIHSQGMEKMRSLFLDIITRDNKDKRKPLNLMKEMGYSDNH